MQVGRRIVSEIVTPINAFPLAAAKQWCKIDFNDDDAIITSLIRAAFKSVNTYLGYSALSANVKIEFDGLSGLPAATNPITGGVIIQGSYLQLATYIESVDALHYVNSNNQLTAMGSGDWSNPTAISLPKMCVKIPVKNVPSDLTEDSVKYVVSVKEGYTALPEDILMAVRLLVSQWYDNRSAIVTGVSTTTLDNTVQFLLDPYRSMQVL